MEWIQVPKEKFYEFINAYPNKLSYDVYGAVEPPLASYNDFTNGKVWPESMVAKISLYDPSSEYYNFKQPEYFLCP